MRTLTFTNAYPEDVRTEIVGGEEDPFLLADLKLEWLAKDWHVLVHDDGRVVAHVGLVRAHVHAGDERVEVGGYGGVLTKASERGKGHARAALDVADEQLRAWGVAFGFLFCRPQLVPYYSALGWQELAEPVQVQQSSGPIVFPKSAMVKPLADRAWPSGPVRLEGLPW
ncbi:GNAT family N-acetyltransferase [Deinococcus yavapaiensis]|uniref:Acetyltransferase (GNAT) family protein n=1 Tax=Deinococcus yavapaiensis KR-236 TaxID=694435 RepID=A0A318S642_9DEIO|nr:GNAT family N-acetyltransferase [Deinococcus yavapaiensis]PYE54133.1 acetyltransferase (GNAT) family protein [Deinococcus yavapaiensis KR-236]